MRARLVQRGTVAALVVATVAAALATHLALADAARDTRSERLADARNHVEDSLRRRAFYLEDVADMVGVHDDADVKEFSRYAHVRGPKENAVVGVQWLRRSPDGKLLPPVEAGASPRLVTPRDRRDAALARADRQRAAAPGIRTASSAKKVAISAPVRLANGHAGFYLTVPVTAHRFSGGLSKQESRSAIVGLVDAQALVGRELASGGALPALRLQDSGAPLASVDSDLDNAVSAVVPASGRRWTLTVDGSSLTPLEKALPWLILAFGLTLALIVALVLRQSARGKEAAVRLARERSTELAHSTAMIQRITGAIDECFYAYAIDDDGEVRTRFATAGWASLLGLPEDTGDAVLAWQEAMHPDDRAAYAQAHAQVRAGKPIDIEFRVRDADGGVHWLWAREHPIGGDDGEALVDGVISDISARKAAEAKLAVSLRRVERANHELEQARAEAERRSRVDALTGVFNRRHFSEVLLDELTRRGGREGPALLLLDLDRFKAVNDEHGHLIGDAVLRVAAKRLQSILRGSDCLARWGGEEFAILAPATADEGAVVLGERARFALAGRPIEVDGVSIELTVSVGAAYGVPTADALLDAADHALYAAKRAGRNCVRVQPPDLVEPARSTA